MVEGKYKVEPNTVEEKESTAHVYEKQARTTFMIMESCSKAIKGRPQKGDS